MSKIFQDLLDEDEKQRRNGVSDGLLSGELVDHAILTWDFPVPTLCHVSSNASTNNFFAVCRGPRKEEKTPKTIAGLADRLCKKYPGLNVLLEDPCVLVAGGSVQAELKNQKEKYHDNGKDVDVFLIGMPDIEAANAKIMELSRKLVATWVSLGRVIQPDMEDQMCDMAILTANTLTLNGKFKCQFILRLYKTKEEVLFGFDLPCCSIGVTGSSVYYTPLCALALTSNVCAIRPHRASPSFLFRMNKYFSRGYDLALVGSVPFATCTSAMQSPCKKTKSEGVTDRYRGFLGNLAVEYTKDKAQPNKMICSSIDWVGPTLEENMHDYVDRAGYAHVAWKHHAMLNLGQVDHPCPNIFVADLSESLSVSSFSPLFTVSDLSKYVNRFLLKRDVDVAIRARRVVFKSMLKMFPKECLQLLQTNNMVACVKLVERYRESVVQRLNQPEVINPRLNWLVTNPGEQLTASFQPCPMAPEDLYAELFNSFDSLKIK